MFQIKVSVDSCHGYWLDYIYDKLNEKIKTLNGVYARKRERSRDCLCFAVGADNKRIAKNLIATVICDNFIENQKRTYFNELLNVDFCDLVSRQMLLNTLTTFNSIAERNYVLHRLKLTSDFNLDGFYNFRLRDLIEQWRESASMIIENAEILREEESFNVMLRFLLSSIDARFKVVYLRESGKCFSISTRNEADWLEQLTEAQLLVKLAEIAPERVVLCSKVSNTKLVKKIGEIFCLKEKN